MATASSRKVLSELLWAEKYRPKILDEIVNQEEIVQRLKLFVKERNMPHLLFAGPPGTGKTTAAHALAHDLYGEDYRMYMLETNASVSKNTPLLVKIKGRVRRTTFAELDQIYFGDKTEETLIEDVNDLEVLTVDKNYKVKWGKVSRIIRHKVPAILRVHVEGGGVIELTGNHSVMVLTENGLESIKASQLKEGNFLLSFVTKLPGSMDNIPLLHYPVKKSKRVRYLTKIPVDENTSHVFGLFAAEGAVGFSAGTSGQVIFTFGNPETQQIKEVHEFAQSLGLSHYENKTASGFDRSRLTATQVRIGSTQLARFFKENFYQGDREVARNKRIPDFIFEFPLTERIAFLKGLSDGDGSGKWCNVVRISSVSEDMLVDVTWLGRVSGVETSIFQEEARLIWKGGMKWKKSDLVDAGVVIKLIEKLSGKIKGNWRYILRHPLYEGKRMVSKRKIDEVLSMIDVESLNVEERKTYETLKRLSKGDIHTLKIVRIEFVEYNDYVYDVSVPGNEMFFAGTIPILLHNSDERGIDVIRTKVKEFARSKLPANIPFKVILLDEADNMTADAQQALRRLMEMYVTVTRFILIANYPSKIIEPIQSRCAVFRFTPLKKEDVISRLSWICGQEGIKCREDALEAIYDISGGDMRKSINILQTASALGEVTVSNVYKVVGLAHPKEVREMIAVALKGDFMKARDMLRGLMTTYGLSGTDIVKQIHREIFSTEIDIPEAVRIELADYIGEIQFRIVEGADDEIQLNTLLARISLVGNSLKGKK